jgi:hypothetical protein
MSIRNSSRAALAALGVAVAFAPAVAFAQDKDQNIGTGEDLGMDIAAGVATVVYAPAKMLYAAGGGLVAGLAYVFSAGDTQVTDPILTPAVRGDYYVTADQLRGEKQLDFIGRAAEPPGAEAEPTVASQSGDGLDSTPPVSSEAIE